MPSKSDTIPAMLTPGEVVLNEKQQKALEKYVGQSREEILCGRWKGKKEEKIQ